MSDKAPLYFEARLGMLHDLLVYDPEAGTLFWRSRPEHMFVGKNKPAVQLQAAWNTRYAGQPALHHLNNRGYRAGHILGQPFLAHRVIWALVHGEWPDFIDHLNGDRSDNCIANLRSVDRRTNNRNRRLNRNSTSGICGVKQLRNGRWSARIRIDGRNKWLGTFDSSAEAAAAREAASATHGFHSNHGGVNGR